MLLMLTSVIETYASVCLDSRELNKVANQQQDQIVVKINNGMGQLVSVRLASLDPMEIVLLFLSVRKIRFL